MRQKLMSVLLSILLILQLMIPVSSFAIENDSEEINDIFEIGEGYLVDDLEVNESPICDEFYDKLEDEINGVKVAPLKINTNYDLIDSKKIRANVPSYYDLRQQQRVTPVKDQGPNGSCWAFATYGTAESILLPAQNKDFSEKHMRNTHGFDWGPDDGGNRDVAAAYLARWGGPIKESDDPYSPYDFSSPSYLKPSMELDKIYFVPDVRGAYDTEELKQAIMTYGACYTTVYGNRDYTNMQTMGHYDGGQGRANHAVTIVGWDDSFSRNLFNYSPPGDGAWIVKNSWGSNWGSKQGYYYVSYYDSVIARNNSFVFLKPKNENKSIWSYDPLGMTSTMGGSSNTAYFANVFGPSETNIEVTEVGFFVPSNGASYEIYIDKNAGSSGGFNGKVHVKSGTTQYAGYVTVDIPPQLITSGSYFAPIVKLTTPGYSKPIPVEKPVSGYSSRARASRGQSFISYNGSQWMDLTSRISNGNVCLKAFTVPAGSNPNPGDVLVESINIMASNTNLKVGESQKYSVVVNPINASNKVISWNSSDSNVCVVNDGLVQAVGEGTCQIIASATDGSNVSGQITVTVSDSIGPGPDDPTIYVSSVKIDASQTALKPGETVIYSVEVSPKNATNKSISWSSSNSSVCRVSNGKVEAISQGECVITAQAIDGHGAKDSVNVIVKNDVIPSTFTVSVKPQIKEIGAAENQIVYIYCTANGSAVENADLTITVTDPNGATKVSNKRTNKDGISFFQYSPGKKAPLGTYRVSVNASLAGASGIGEGRFLVIKKPDRYKLNVESNFDKEEYKVGETAKAKIYVTNKYGIKVRRANIKAKISGGGNEKIIKSKTDKQGIATLEFTVDENSAADTYSISIEAKKYSLFHMYRGSSVHELKFIEVVEPDDPDPNEVIFRMIETDEGQKMIEENISSRDFVLLDVRTKAEYLESHIEGSEFKNYYDSDFEEYIDSLDRKKVYLVYCRTQSRSGKTANLMKEKGFYNIYWMNGGMTKWLKENRPSIFPEYDKVLDAEIVPEKPSCQAGETINIKISITDIQGNEIRKGKADLKVLNESSEIIFSQELKMGNDGTKDCEIKIPLSERGKLRLIANATHKDFEPAEALAVIRIDDDEEFESFASRKEKGQFSHLDENSAEYKSLEKYYGKNIYKYNVIDSMQVNNKIEDIIDYNKNTILVFGYPMCGPCVDMWVKMSKLPHDKYTFIEVVTSVGDNPQEIIDLTNEKLEENNIVEFGKHIYYDAVDKIWNTRMGFITTPNTLFIDKNGRVVNIAGALSKEELYRLYYKTFGESIDGNIPDPDEPELENLNIYFDVNKTEIRTNESITFTTKVRKENGKILGYAPIRYTLSSPDGKTITYDERLSRYGIDVFTTSLGSSEAQGKWTVSVEYRGDKYNSEVQSKEFEFINDAPPEPDNVLVSSVEIIANNKTLKVGENVIYSTVIAPVNATNKNLSWSSSDEKVCTVVDGNVRALSEGVCTIKATATDGSGVFGSVEVSVSNTEPDDPDPNEILVTSVTINASQTEFKVGESAVFTATVKPTNATNSNLTWSSSDENICAVDDGRVKALSEGECYIYAQATDGSGKWGSKKVIVKSTDPGPGPDEKIMSYQDRYNNGEFNHNSGKDLANKLQSAYGKNIMDYTIYTLNGGRKTIRDVVDGERPTLIVLGQPG